MNLNALFSRVHVATHPNDVTHGSSDELFQQMEVRLIRQESGFGFRIIGGKEEGTQATVGEIKSGGAADHDGRLQVMDRLLCRCTLKA